MTTSKPNPLDQFLTNVNREREEELTQKRAQELNLAYQNLVGFQPDPAAVRIIPKELASSGQVFTFDKSGTTISLAVTDPTNPNTLAALRKLEAMDEYSFKPVLVSDSSLKYLLAVYETFAPTTNTKQDLTLDPELVKNLSQITDLSSLQATLGSSSTSVLIETLLAGAAATTASDIHIEPTGTAVRVRYRLDGVLQDIADLPPTHLETIINRLKLMAGLKLNITQTSQDGRFSIIVGDTNFDLRLSVLPTQYGESAVIRLLPQTGEFVKLEDLGLDPTNLQKIQEAAAQPNGLILNTGPTGSGKTTTLYSLIAHLNTPTTKIVTIEDPIEYRLDGITQTQVSEEDDYSFANALRAIVRQDPDIILVGEIRDSETADIAINASLTGHLVLSTLHTNTAAGAIPRLTDLDAKPEIFADALRLIIAQRLVRKLCAECKTGHAPTPKEIIKINTIRHQAPTPTTIYSSKGCTACNGTGYRGRVGLFEILAITPELRTKIAGGATAETLETLAIESGMTPLGDDGITKLTAGITSLEELTRVLEKSN